MEYLKNLFNDQNIDFVGKRRFAGLGSVVLVALAWVLFVAIGPNWGIDFTGGTEIQIRFEETDVSIDEVRVALTSMGLSQDAVQQVGAAEDGQFIIRIQDATFGSAELKSTIEEGLRARYGESWMTETRFSAEVGARLAVFYTGERVDPKAVQALFPSLDGLVVQEGLDENEIVFQLPGLSQQIAKSLKGALSARTFEVLSVDSVGPKVGGDLRRQGFMAVLFTLGLVLLYIAFRFDLSFAPGAILALIHDVSITVGFFVVFQKEFNLPTIGALLTIVGYSLNDTIVIYDRIRENQAKYRRANYAELINKSINETLSRTLATSFTTMLAILPFLFMGSSVIGDFAFAMMLGIIFGTYSTIYVASPMILVMEDLKPTLSRFVATSAPPPDEGESEVPGMLTESEKRRRERAAKDKARSADSSS